jgi:hypothetical protein
MPSPAAPLEKGQEAWPANFCARAPTAMPGPSFLPQPHSMAQGLDADPEGDGVPWFGSQAGGQQGRVRLQRGTYMRLCVFFRVRFRSSKVSSISCVF